MRKTIILSALGLALGLAGPAIADDHSGDRQDRGDRSERSRSHDDRAERRDYRGDSQSRADDNDDLPTSGNSDHDGRKDRHHRERHSDRRS